MSRFSALALPVDEPSRMIIHHPITGQPLRDCDGNEAYIEGLSADSQKAQSFERKISNARLARRNRTAPLSVEELRAEHTDRLAEMTTGWHLVGLDGSPIDVPFSTAAARELYNEPAMLWLREQWSEWQANRANFSKASSTTSADTQNTDSAST